MKRLLRDCASALTLIIVTNPVMARTPIAPASVPAQGSLEVRDTPQGFVIALARPADRCIAPAATRLGMSVLIDAALLRPTQLARSARP